MSDRESWDDYFMRIARDVATRSKDRSTRVGAVIVGPDREIRSTGYNGFPRGVNDDPDERHERPTKYLLTVHGEMNAICNAARAGISINGCTIYVAAWRPCVSCSILIIQSGIIEVVCETLDAPHRDGWDESDRWSKTMFQEAGVVVRLPNCMADGQQKG